MKYFLPIIALLFSSFSFSEVRALDEALESDQIRVEYIEQTNRGLVYPSGCDLCKETYYEFDANTKFISRGRSSDLEAFLTTYTEKKYFTLFVKPESNQILRLSF